MASCSDARVEEAAISRRVVDPALASGSARSSSWAPSASASAHRIQWRDSPFSPRPASSASARRSCSLAALSRASGAAEAGLRRICSASRSAPAAPRPEPAGVPCSCSSARPIPVRSPCVMRPSQTGSSGRARAHLPQGDQVAGKVAAVHGRDVGRLQHREVAQVVPVVEVPAEAAQLFERLEDAGEPLDHLPGRDEAEVARAPDREQLQPDVGGRGSCRHHRHGFLLEVVRRQPVRRFADEAVEKTPVEQAVAEGGVPLVRG